MIGNGERTAVKPDTYPQLPVRRRLLLNRYFAIDGGHGAHLLAALAGSSPYIQAVASPRHADILLIIAPVSRKLVPSIVEIAEALPQPAHVLLVEEQAGELDPRAATDIADLDELFPGARRMKASSGADIHDAMLDPAPWMELTLTEAQVPDVETIQLPPKPEQEMATELVVLSLGPIQPFTAGPLRVLLICDGEQVFATQVESGYAHRGIAQAMLQAHWQQALTLSRTLDPLAPLACQLAYVRVLEQLQGWQPSPATVSMREAALALERARNYLWWVVRFMRLLSDAHFSDRSYQLANAYEVCLAQVWRQRPRTWLLPQRQEHMRVDAAVVAKLHRLASDVEALCTSIERNRWLKLRTRGIGELAAADLRERNVSGPVLLASEHGVGDVQDRVVTRLQQTASDLHGAVAVLEQHPSVATHAAHWDIPVGEAHASVQGPRGCIGIHVKSDGGAKPGHVEWQAPSAALLPLLPELLAGQKLADAEIILASLDLALAEVDG